jgi:hypothetical protein
MLHCAISWASYHYARASKHKHKLECILTWSKSESTKYHLVVILCFHWSLLVGYTLKVRIRWVITWKPHQTLIELHCKLFILLWSSSATFSWHNSLNGSAMSVTILMRSLIVIPLPSLKIRIAIANYSWTSRTFQSRPDHSGGYNLEAASKMFRITLQFFAPWLIKRHISCHPLSLILLSQSLPWWAYPCTFWDSWHFLP